MPEEKKAPAAASPLANPSEMSRLQQAIKDAVAGQLADGRKHGWTEKDNQAVIEALVAEDASIEIAKLVAAKKDPTGYVVSDNALELMSAYKLLNASAHRQQLEKAKKLEESPEKRVRREVNNLYS